MRIDGVVGGWMKRSRGMTWAWVAAVVGIGMAVAGCASGGKAAIESGAHVVKSGTGSLDYTAPRDGDVWVNDATANRLLVLTATKKGQVLHVDAAASEVRVDDKVVSQRPINANHQYQVYFRPADQRSDR
jgi:hypothetical protein